MFGKIFIYKVRDEDGLPRYQHIPPHRIDNPRKGNKVAEKGRLSKGPYAGKRSFTVLS